MSARENSADDRSRSEGTVPEVKRNFPQSAYIIGAGSSPENLW